jgi:hypothetical protein
MMRTDASERLIHLINKIEDCCTAAASCAAEAATLLIDDQPTQAAGRQSRTGGNVGPAPSTAESRPTADPGSMSIVWHGRRCALGQTTLFKLFSRLSRQANAYVSYDQLLSDVWGGAKADETIRSAVRHLKRRLKDAGMGELADAIRGENHHYVLLLDPPL